MECPPKKRSKDDKEAENGSPLTSNKRGRLDLTSDTTSFDGVDLSQRVSWGKFAPYTDTVVTFTPVGTAPDFSSDSPALCFHLNAISHRARACTIHLKQQPGQRHPRPVETPIFMPVGTKGCLKALPLQELVYDPALSCPIILANTYHLAIQPKTELIAEMGGLHSFQGLDQIDGNNHSSYNLLTDSGGFQMVSLVKLSQVSEEGVSFENPFTQRATSKDQSTSDMRTKDLLLLRPEDSIRHQNNIGANIIMALDDVVSSVTENDERFVTATHRTLRWYDRCYKSHAKKDTQNLFPIVQGGLDTGLGGLREQCLAGFRHRELDLNYQTPGYAIGGLAGGESKEEFWRVVDQCCRALPDNKPRYLMGVGYPLDLVVCTALGVDMYDCVYPTRTARFGTCLVQGPAPGTLKLKSHKFASDHNIIEENCSCQACRKGITRATLHSLLKTGNPVAVELITQHNITHMMSLVRRMRLSIMEGTFAEFAMHFVKDQYPGIKCGGEDPPTWVIDALNAAGINVPHYS